MIINLLDCAQFACTRYVYIFISFSFYVQNSGDNSMKRIYVILAVIAISALVASGIYVWQEHARQSILLATTTSVQDSGLLDAILPDFETRNGISVHVVAVGTGQALEYGKRGDAHCLLVHAPALENVFMQNGYGIRRITLFWNTFVLIGPKTNPAGINGTDNITQAFLKIWNAGAVFVSRGDLSGTHVKEMEIWAVCGIDKEELKERTWYVNASVGMGTTLQVANERNGYTLSDIATYLRWRQKLTNLMQMQIAVTPEIRNDYSVIITKTGSVEKTSETDAFWNWMCSAQTRSMIENYTINSERVYNVYW